MATAASGSGNGAEGDGATTASDFSVICECEAGLCTVEPLLLNPRFLFVCCPRGQADAGGCGFMQWRDTVDPTNISPRPGSPPPSPPPRTGSTQGSQGVPPQKMCPCGAGACSIGIAKNGQSFYSCSVCTYRQWCDEKSSSRCYICREEGHWYMHCPRLPPAVANNQNICFYCKQDGHYAAQCPMKHPRKRRN